MDYVETATLSRLKQVIDGEQWEISEAVNRQWWWEFIYCELKKYNQSFIEEIEDAKDTNKLLKIRDEMKERAYFKYNFDMQKFEENLDEFKDKSLKEQKVSASLSRQSKYASFFALQSPLALSPSL